MTPRLALLVLLVAVTCSAVPQKLTKTINGDDTDGTDTDKKFFGPLKPITDGIGTAISNQNPLTTLLLGGALGAGAGALGGGLLGNKPNNNCGGGGFGRRRRQAGDAENGGDPNDPNSKFFGLFGNNGNNCNNPCGRKRRQADGVDTGEKVDSKFFGLFGNGGGNNNPCGNNGFNQQPQGFNNGFNNNQGFNNQNRICQCTNFSKRNNGYEEAQCATNDHTGRRWCYSTSNSQCGDAVFSKNYPNNKWSYQACTSGTRGATTSSVCECSDISKKDNQGVEEAQCAKSDHTGQRWCYSTSNSNCGDATVSNKYPSNPWSYQACGSSTRGATSVCQCTNISKKDNQGVEEAQCAKADHTGNSWCYSTSDSKCSDATVSNKHPSNPWSYQACSIGNTSG